MPDSNVSGSRPVYRRVILKLSGESLAHSGERGISMDEVTVIAKQVKQAHELGCQIALVIGGGNILRGGQFKGSAGEMIQEATAHYMGMLATVINALAMQDALENIGCTTRVMSAIKMDGVAEPFIRPSSYPSFGKGADRHPCRRNGGAVRDDRHRRCQSRFGAGRRYRSQGDASRRRLQR